MGTANLYYSGLARWLARRPGGMTLLPAWEGIHDSTSIDDKPFGSLLSDCGKPRICRNLPITL